MKQLNDLLKEQLIKDDEFRQKYDNLKEKWFLLGDIHGESMPIKDFYEKNRERLSLDFGNNYIILLEEVGANFALKGQRDIKFKKALSKYPFTYICLRGNHEARVQKIMKLNSDKWEIKKKYGGEVYVEN